MKRFISFLMVLSLIVSLVGCSDSRPHPALSDPDEQVIVENTEAGNIINETIITECITSEIYLEELIEAENKISELLLEEETIDEVYLCKTIYVPQENIEEFAEHSQTSYMFGEGIDFKSVLTKVAVGTGVIVTVVVLKKVELSDPVMSVVAAADKSLKFGASGAVVGTLLGGFIGATDELDRSGRTSAVIGFAMATVGLILSTISLVAVIPSGGSTATTLAVGIKIVISGISVVAATGGTANAGYQAVKTFTSTDSTDIDWNNIDWDRLGVTSAEKAIANGANGYMWGAIIGVVHGGTEGYDFYWKYNTPYTKYDARLMQTPMEGGKWIGDRGESDFVLDKPIELSDGTKISRVTYKNCVPDFSLYQKAQVKIPNMTDKRYGKEGNFEQANEVLAEYWSKIKFNGKTWTASDIETYRAENNLTWHEMSNMESMQLVPREVNQTFTHYGGVAEYNAMVGQGVTSYD